MRPCRWPATTSRSWLGPTDRSSLPSLSTGRTTRTNPRFLRGDDPHHGDGGLWPPAVPAAARPGRWSGWRLHWPGLSSMIASRSGSTACRPRTGWRAWTRQPWPRPWFALKNLPRRPADPALRQTPAGRRWCLRRQSGLASVNRGIALSSLILAWLPPFCCWWMTPHLASPADRLTCDARRGTCKVRPTRCPTGPVTFGRRLFCSRAGRIRLRSFAVPPRL